MTDKVITDDDTPTFKGNVEFGSTISIYANDDVIGSFVITNSNGS